MAVGSPAELLLVRLPLPLRERAEAYALAQDVSLDCFVLFALQERLAHAGLEFPCPESNAPG